MHSRISVDALHKSKLLRHQVCAQIAYADNSVKGVKGKGNFTVNSMENSLPCFCHLRDDCCKDIMRSCSEILEVKRN
jgi:hypothetical protein